MGRVHHLDSFVELLISWTEKVYVCQENVREFLKPLAVASMFELPM